jgi:AraC-like DNA-binding protein
VNLAGVGGAALDTPPKKFLGALREPRMPKSARTPKHLRNQRAAARPPTFAEQTSAIDDPTGPLGIRLVSQREGDRVAILADRARTATLILPVHAGIAAITVGEATHLVDRASWMLVPAGTRAIVRAKSPVTHTLLLAISAPLRASVVHAYAGEISIERFERYAREAQVLPRTNWVNELCHRYLFERAVCEKRDNVATAFLEMEIVKELYFVCHEGHTSRERASVAETSRAGAARPGGRAAGAEPPAESLVKRAIALVEANLFEPDVVQRLAVGCGASPSSLLRSFKRELGQGPLAYVRARRLDESMLLLKSKRFAVGEIAMMVGYRNFAAFSQAFRARFAMRPSEVAGA